VLLSGIDENIFLPKTHGLTTGFPGVLSPELQGEKGAAPTSAQSPRLPVI